MVMINLQKKKFHLNQIKKTLRRRNLTPNTDRKWEIHKPAINSTYITYVGYAKDKNDKNYCVAIYPSVVYKIESFSGWWDTNEDKRITIAKK